MINSPTIQAIQERMAVGVPAGSIDEATVRRLWWAALDTLQEEIFMNIDLKGGIWLASPLPALYDPRLLEMLSGWVWAPDGLKTLQFSNVGLLPPSRARSMNSENNFGTLNFQRFPLLEEDGNDPLLIIITSKLQVALALQGEFGKRKLLMRSDKETFDDLLKILKARLDQEDPRQADVLRQSLAALDPLTTNDDIVKIFWPLVSERLAGLAPSLNIQPLPDRSNSNQSDNQGDGELSLLEAITHEVRTPLATIRTLIRSLLRRNDMSEIVAKRLKQIDSECTEQIDRFGLIFKAAELERKQSNNSGLARIDLGNLLETMSPVWTQQLERRGLMLKLEIEVDLPLVLSDSEQLELMLGGLIDRNSRGLHPGGTLVLELKAAGHRLKLQIFNQEANSQTNDSENNEVHSDLGPVLSWNPITGSLQLSQAATQRLLANLGGRLTHRRESGLTVFFPIAD